MKIVGKIRSVVTVAFLLLYTFYYVNVTMCQHSHVINGIQLVHSHMQFPSKLPVPADGGHTAQQLILIAAIDSSPIMAGIGIVACVAAILLLTRIIGSATASFHSSDSCLYSNHRAPPAAA